MNQSKLFTLIFSAIYLGGQYNEILIEFKSIMYSETQIRPQRELKCVIRHQRVAKRPPVGIHIQIRQDIRHKK
jgi:hypothetical protein